MRTFQIIVQLLVHALLIRPIVYVVFGIAIRGHEKLPRRGPAIVVANHNSHIDTGVMMSLFPIGALKHIRPVAAADYWTARGGFVTWFTRHVIGILTIDRRARNRGEDPFTHLGTALMHGDILIIYPEGTRGEPERMAELKKGIAHLLESHPEVPVVPVFLRGMGRVLPRGSWLPVPFFIDIAVGDALHWTGSRESFMATLRAAMSTLETRARGVAWD